MRDVWTAHHALWDWYMDNASTLFLPTQETGGPQTTQGRN